MSSMSPYQHYYHDQNDNGEMPTGYQINYYDPYHPMQRVPLVESDNNSLNGAQAVFSEEWKFSSQQKQQQQQQLQQQQVDGWRVSCPPSKPLPQEPPAPPPRRSFMVNAVSDAGPWYHSEQPYWAYPPTTATVTDPYMMEHQPQPPTPPDYEYNQMVQYEKPQYDSVEKENDQQQSPKQQKVCEKEKPKSDPLLNRKKSDNKLRQITVQSINKEHRVWINIDTTETGLTLAQKIHTIATFRTRKILSITTSSGRSVPLDHRPVFGSWMDMDDFKNGEQWKVEWGQLDKGLMDKIVSRFVQVSGSKRK
ncbi:hypothetical protein BDC45DRAFT_511052 [Circinella umbellata]|nr:hypothetical protein BDC45DRAFT_511052 [Circinella umbellata]